MIFKVVYDKDCRLRIRLGRFGFNKNEGYGLVDLIYKKDYVNFVVTSHRNGSILIEYEDRSYREDLLNFLKNISYTDIKAREANDDEIIREIDDLFFFKIVKKVSKRFFIKLFIPSPIKAALAIYDAIPYIKKGWNSLTSFEPNVDLLDGVAISASLLNGSFGSAASVMFLLSLSELLEEYTLIKAKNTLKNSLAINIDNVWLVQDDGAEISYPLADIVKGDVIKVRTGEMIPVDGVVVDGEAMVNESSMTGEPLAILKSEFKTVYAGTTIEEGSLNISVISANEDTRINKIINLIESSDELKAEVQGKAETLADRFVPYSLAFTGLTYLFSGNVQKALSVLMVDFSCAIKLANPLVVISTIHEAADHRILVKGGKYLEAYAQADIFIFDKTGTLTNAFPQVVKVISLGDYSERDILKMAACIEEHYAHSVARAIVNKADEEGIKHAEEHADVEYIVAHGIATSYNGKRTIIGSKHFIIDDEKVKVNKKTEDIINKHAEKYSLIYLAIGKKLEAIICIEDPVRPEAKEVISQLKGLDIEKVVMLTGDSDNAAKYVAEELGINEYKSQILPEDKYKYIEEYKSKGHKVIMVGDGINDSPALSTADVSVAMKDASDIAREVADITLLNDDLYELVTLRKLSREMFEKIEKNYKSIVVVNSSIILSGVLGLINNTSSSLLHNLSTLAIGVSSTKPLLSE